MIYLYDNFFFSSTFFFYFLLVAFSQVSNNLTLLGKKESGEEGEDGGIAISLSLITHLNIK